MRKRSAEAAWEVHGRNLRRPAERSDIVPGVSDVLFFAGCLMKLMQPDTCEASVQALRRADLRPKVVTRAVCCGQPAYNSGFLDDARRVAEHTLKAIAKTTRDSREDADQPFVVASGSCAAMISRHWPELFQGTRRAEEAKDVAARTVELTVLLASRLTKTPERRGTQTRKADGESVVVLDSCHALRELGADGAIRQVLTSAGCEPVTAEGSDRCCGFGGLFSVKMPDVSAAMADEKLDLLSSTGCETVVGCDLSCLVHLQGRAQRRGLKLEFKHAASVLADRAEVRNRTSQQQ